MSTISSLFRRSNPKKLLILFLLLFSLLFLLGSAVVTAASDVEGIGVARIIDVIDKNVKDGSIISSGAKGATLSKVPFDPQVLGVVSRNAAIVLSNDSNSKGLPVISTGTVYLLVSTQKGTIKKGDLLTTSTIPGVAVKADGSGYMLGNAMENYDNPDKAKTGLIVAELDLHYFNAKPTFPGSLTDIFKIALLSTDNGPSSIFKDIVAALVVLGSFVFGFMTFGRTAAKGVEALGRNPAANKTIHLGIIFNVSIVVSIVLAGVVVAFLILRL